MATSTEIKNAVKRKRITLKTKITLPILIPNLLFTKIPSISEPSNTAPFFMVKTIPAPRKSPPKMAIKSLSSVIEAKFSKCIITDKVIMEFIDFIKISLDKEYQARIKKGILTKTNNIEISRW